MMSLHSASTECMIPILTEVTMPLVGPSYDAELAAAIAVFGRPIPHGSRYILWTTDSRSLIDALRGNIFKAAGQSQILCN